MVTYIIKKKVKVICRTEEPSFSDRTKFSKSLSQKRISMSSSKKCHRESRSNTRVPLPLIELSPSVNSDISMHELRVAGYMEVTEETIFGIVGQLRVLLVIFA